MKSDINGYLLSAIDEVAKSKMSYQMDCVNKKIPVNSREIAGFEEIRNCIIRQMKRFD